MGETTGIAWTDRTYNPWYGCREVSPGCDHCYAHRDMARYGRAWLPTRAGRATFQAPIAWEKEAVREARQIKVFTCSWSDFFIREADPWRQDAWDIIRDTPHLTYQVLTKRPGLLVAWAKTHGWLPNVWAGVSVESQKYAPRLDVLARLRSLPDPNSYNATLFASCEPLLGPLDLHPWLVDDTCNWVIVGGESGPGCRRMYEPWPRGLRDQCREARVPFFFKQWGGMRASHGDMLDGMEHRAFPR